MKKLVFLLVFQVLFLVQLFSQSQNNRFMIAWYDHYTTGTTITQITQNYKNLQNDFFNCAIPVFRLIRNSSWGWDLQYAIMEPDKAFMDSAYKYDIKILLNTPDNGLQRQSKPWVWMTQYNPLLSQDGLSYWGNHPALWGFHIYDEPYDQGTFPLFIPYANDIRAFNPNLLRLVNLPPKLNEMTYPECEQFIQDYIDATQPNILSFDNYPIMNKYIPPYPNWYNGLFYNLDIMSRKSVENEIPFIHVFSSWRYTYINDTICIESKALSKETTGYFINVALTYGAKGVAHWNGWSITELTRFTAQHREYVRNLHKKILEHEDVLLSLQFQSAYHKSNISTLWSGIDTIPPYSKWQNFSSDPHANAIFNVSNPLIAMPGSTTDSLMVSFLTDNLGNRYFWVFNKSLVASEDIQFNLKNGNNAVDVLNDMPPCLSLDAIVHLAPAEAKLFRVMNDQYIAPTRTITASETWQNKKMVYENIVVNPSVVLTIKDSVLFGAKVSITIQPGAKLVIDGGTLTNACGNQMWLGIQVLGNKSLSQTATNQGTLELKNDAIIENARNAISTWNGSNYNTSGGIIKATDAIFRNNRRSVEFMSYPHTNSSTFNNCTFTINDNNLLAYNNTSFSDHVTMWDVHNVRFNGCHFENVTSNAPFGKAIGTEDAQFTVNRYCTSMQVDICGDCMQYTPSSFTGFNTAIGANSFSTATPFTIDRSTFSANQIGVVGRSVNNAQIIRSNFTLNNPVAYGGYFENSSGYKIEGNTIGVPVGSPPVASVGLYIIASGTANNLIYRNNLSYLTHGIYVTGTNGVSVKPAGSGLEFHCNNFNHNQYDVYIPAGSSIHPSQGNLGKGADNHFQNTNIRSISNATGNISITYYFSNQSYHTPHNVSSNVILSNTAAIKHCTSTFCDGFVIINPKLSGSGYEDLLRQSQQLKAQLRETREGSEEYAALYAQYYDITSRMYRISQESLYALYAQEDLDLNDIIAWYNIIPTLTAKYSLVETYEQMDSYERARLVLQTIPQQFEFTEEERIEYQNYTDLFNFKEGICRSGRNWAQMTDSEIAELQLIAEGSKGKSSTMAKGALCFFYDICYDPDFISNAPSNSPKDPTSPSLGVERNRNAPEIQVLPNPTDGNLTVFIPELPEGSVIFQVFDVMGRNMITQPLTDNNTSINLSQLAQGVYYYQLINNNIIIKSDKLVKR